ncbi:MAG: MBL fold metallo-hydrolase [Clostridiales bacterium]|nr:MBL fold metallo-hydrolase [Clostridiales bacterium]
MISLRILSENRDNGQFKGEGGLSVLVEAFGNMFLLDTGYSNLFLHNANLLGVDLSKINVVVLTHGHSDHTNGIPYLDDGKSIILHPASFKDRWSIRKKEYVGLPMSEEKLKEKHNVFTTKDPVEFFPNCYFLGEIPMVVDFEKNGNFSTTLDEQLTQKDFTEDDSGVAINTEQGLVVMTGCGHRGVCNTIEHAKNVTGQKKIYAVFGGFHLRNLIKQKDVIDSTIEYFKQNDIKELYLGHCVTDEVIDYIEQNLPNVKITRLSAGKECGLGLEPFPENVQ